MEVLSRPDHQGGSHGCGAGELLHGVSAGQRRTGREHGGAAGDRKRRDGGRGTQGDPPAAGPAGYEGDGAPCRGVLRVRAAAGGGQGVLDVCRAPVVGEVVVGGTGGHEQRERVTRVEGPVGQLVERLHEISWASAARVRCGVRAGSPDGEGVEGAEPGAASAACAARSRARARWSRTVKARTEQPATAAASAGGSPSHAVSRSASRSARVHCSRARRTLSRSWTASSADGAVDVQPCAHRGEPDLVGATGRTALVGDDVAGHHQQPGQGFVGHLLGPAPRDEEGLGDDVVALAGLDVASGVGADAGRVLPEQGAELLVELAAVWAVVGGGGWVTVEVTVWVSAHTLLCPLLPPDHAHGPNCVASRPAER